MQKGPERNAGGLRLAPSKTPVPYPEAQNHIPSLLLLSYIALIH